MGGFFSNALIRSTLMRFSNVFGNISGFRNRKPPGGIIPYLLGSLGTVLERCALLAWVGPTRTIGITPVPIKPASSAISAGSVGGWAPGASALVSTSVVAIAVVVPSNIVPGVVVGGAVTRRAVYIFVASSRDGAVWILVCMSGSGGCRILIVYAKPSWVGAPSSASGVGVAVVIARSFVATRRARASRVVFAAIGGAVGSGSSVLTVNTVSFNSRQCRCLGILNSVLPDLPFVGTAGHSAGLDCCVAIRDEDDPQALSNSLHVSAKLGVFSAASRK